MRKTKSVRIDRYLLIVAAAKSDMTLSEVAENAGMSRATVSNIKRGCSCKPSTAQKIADALGVELETILEKR